MRWFQQAKPNFILHLVKLQEIHARHHVKFQQLHCLALVIMLRNFLRQTMFALRYERIHDNAKPLYLRRNMHRIMMLRNDLVGIVGNFEGIEVQLHQSLEFIGSTVRDRGKQFHLLQLLHNICQSLEGRDLLRKQAFRLDELLDNISQHWHSSKNVACPPFHAIRPD